jgi:hypothetical protein
LLFSPISSFLLSNHLLSYILASFSRRVILLSTDEKAVTQFTPSFNSFFTVSSLDIRLKEAPTCLSHVEHSNRLPPRPVLHNHTYLRILRVDAKLRSNQGWL